jgi:hypothetical protein
VGAEALGTRIGARVIGARVVGRANLAALQTDRGAVDAILERCEEWVFHAPFISCGRVDSLFLLPRRVVVVWAGFRLRDRFCDLSDRMKLDDFLSGSSCLDGQLVDSDTPETSSKCIL